MVLNLTIDNKEISASKDATVLEAARENGIYIPTLCDNPKLKPYGGCRLCLVEIKGLPRPVGACTTPIQEGMVVQTSTERIHKLRRTVVELLLSDHPNDCMVCVKAGDCLLQELAYLYDLQNNRFYGEKRQYTQKDGNPFLERDMEKCILCRQCVRVCEEIAGVSAIEIAYRGFKAKVCPSFEDDLNCEFCGQCVSVCPTGALSGKAWSRKGRTAKTNEVTTTCPFCGCGCSLKLRVSENEVVRVSSDPDTINEGWLCVKGRFAYEFINSPDRLDAPLIRKNGKLEKASWDETLDYIYDKMDSIKQEHGPDAIGGLLSARCTNEENYLFQKFMRAVVGTNNVDHCARL